MHGLSFFTLDNKTTMHIMAYNGSQVNIAEICRNWQPWVSARFASWVARQEMVKMVKMVENGLPRLFGRKWFFRVS